MIASFGLPVVMTTGRLVVLTMAGVTRHSMGVVTAAAGMAFDVFSSIAVRPSKSARRMFWSV